MSELKDLLTKAVKAMEGLADTEEGDSKTGSNCRIPGPPNVLLKKAANAVRSPEVDE